MPSQPSAVRSAPYTWADITDMVLGHRRDLVVANLVAILGTAAAVPIPLPMPLLVDEVLLDRPGAMVAAIDAVFPVAWHGALLSISVILLATLVLRLASLALAVWQTRSFARISKDVIFRIRRDLLDRLQRVSMAEYETLGSGTVASHLVTDLDAVDAFVGTATAKFLVAVLSILGTAVVLLWMHWQLGLFILLLNPVREAVRRMVGLFAGFNPSVEEVRIHQREVIAAIRSRDGAAAGAAADRHLERGKEHLLARLEAEATVVVGGR